MGAGGRWRYARHGEKTYATTTSIAFSSDAGAPLPLPNHFAHISWKVWPPNSLSSATTSSSEEGAFTLIATRNVRTPRRQLFPNWCV